MKRTKIVDDLEGVIEVVENLVDSIITYDDLNEIRDAVIHDLGAVDGLLVALRNNVEL